MNYKQIAENNTLILKFMQNSELILEITKLPDWNCLILAVDKINRIVDENNYGYGIGVRYAQIEATYKAVVKFILWYNKQGQAEKKTILVLKCTEHPAHSQHWSELANGRIHITSYCPDTLSEPVVVHIKRKYALRMLETSLKEGWTIMFNGLFTNEELRGKQ